MKDITFESRIKCEEKIEFESRRRPILLKKIVVENSFPYRSWNDLYVECSISAHPIARSTDTSETVYIVQLTRHAFLDKNRDGRPCVLAQNQCSACRCGWNKGWWPWGAREDKTLLRSRCDRWSDVASSATITANGCGSTIGERIARKSTLAVGKGHVRKSAAVTLSSEYANVRLANESRARSQILGHWPFGQSGRPTCP